jgi:hypothetical protein
LKAVPRILGSGRYCSGTVCAARMGTVQSILRSLDSVKGRPFGPQLYRGGHMLHGMGIVDWISSRIGLIISRSLDLR